MWYRYFGIDYKILFFLEEWWVYIKVNGMIKYLLGGGVLCYDCLVFINDINFD